jgi:hypothetical protein
MHHDRYLYTLGQIAGYGSGFAAWMNVTKDIIGLIGILAGAALSVWALYDRYKKYKAGDK